MVDFGFIANGPKLRPLTRDSTLPTTILLYARTGSGKTTQIGRLAEDVNITSNKITRLYTADRGGLDTIQPYIDLGIIEVEAYDGTDPWIWLNRVVRGQVKRNGKWALDKAANAKVGLMAFESAHAIANLLKLDMERKAAQGINIGGDTNTSFDVTDGTEKFKIGTTKGFQKFSIPQARIWEEIMESHRLDTDYVLWTAGLNKGDDDINAAAKIIGPDILGNALTPKLPMDFHYTFRMDVIPGKGEAAPRHVLYLGTQQDVNAGNATALGNIRRPLDAEPLKSYIVEPADLAKALKLVRHDAKADATKKIKARIEAARKQANLTV